MYGRYILYVGERDMYKNFSKFVRDISPVLHRHSDLLVICTGKPFEETEKRLLHEQRVFNKFIYKFVESQQELLDLYHYAIVFVYPSEYEGFGIPILESYKAGCPVLLNRASCFPEIAGDAAIYFDFNSCGNSLQDQIEDILTWSSSKKDELISKQYQRLLRYSWNKSAQELASIYRKVALGVL
jgi:glycosyltransferase involved in cell wall biosynthesis